MIGQPRGVALWKVGVAVIAAIALLGGLLTLLETLRHPGATGPPVPSVGEQDVDPRIDVDCPEPQPREGEDRDTAAAAPSTDPVDITSADLLDCPETYDRALVSFQGEVVGQPLRRERGAWVALNDDAYAQELGPLPSHRQYRGGNEGLAVLLPQHVADRIGAVGGPGRRGDLVTVTGVFHRVDPDSGSTAVIRARHGDIVGPGGAIAKAEMPVRERVAALLALLAIGLIAAERVHAARWRRGY